MSEFFRYRKMGEMKGQICATEKLLKEFRLTRTTAPLPEEGNPVGTWYADLFYYGGKKCVILMHEASGYCVFGINMNREEIQDLPDLMRLDLLVLMKDDAFTVEQINQVQESLKHTTVCRTNNRKMLGHIKQCLLDVTLRLDSGSLIPQPLAIAFEANHSMVGPYWDPTNALRSVLNGEIPVSHRAKY